MKKIYIVVSSTRTMLAASIKLVTHQPFNHASISLDEGLSQCYSFGRLNPKNPVIGGFVQENFQTNPVLQHAEIKVLSILIPKQQYQAIKTDIQNMYKNKTTYKFNILGLVVAGARIDRSLPNKFYCSQFVAQLLASHGITIMPANSNTVILPHDFIASPICKLEYHGFAHDYSYSKAN